MRFVSLALLIFLFSCKPPETHRTPEALIAVLKEAQHDFAKMPIYADPATGDYEDLAKGKFLVQDSALLEDIVAQKTALEPFIVQHIDSSHSFIYLAAYLKYPAAVPVIKNALLREDYFAYYGWEYGDPGVKPSAAEVCNRNLDDHEYPYQLAAINAIEYISGKALKDAAALTAAEEKKLSEAAAHCSPEEVDENGYVPDCQSRWLLAKFKGEKPPHFDE